MAILTQRRRLALLLVVAVVIGLAGGVAAWALVRLIGLLTNLLLLHRFGFDLPTLNEAVHPGPWLVVVAVAGGVIIGFVSDRVPTVRGHGIPEAMEAVLRKQSRITPATAIAKPTTAALAIGTGAPFGAEGPVIVTGGAIGSLIGQVVPMSPAERKIMLACGAAAGMAGIFGTPIAAVLLALELLLFEFSPRAFIPLVVSSSIATGLHLVLLDSGPLFTVPIHDFSSFGQLPFFVVLGPACGLLAVVISRGLFWLEDRFRQLPLHPHWHPALGSLAFALIGLVVPRALGVGYDSISDVLHGRLAAGVLGVLLVAKLVAWWLATSSGSSAGTLAPIMLIGACFGGVIGLGFDQLLPGLQITSGAFAIVGMASTFGAAAQAPFAALAFGFEVTHDYQIILPLMVATVLADFVAGSLLQESLMTEKLARRGIQVHAEYEVDVLRMTPVSRIMTTDVETVPADATVGRIRQLFELATHGAYPIVDADGELAGIISRRDILRTEVDDDASIVEIASTDIVTATPDSDAGTALQLMLEGRFGHLPVVRDGTLVGIVTRTDIVRARMAQIERERRQPGWRPVRNRHDENRA